MKQLAVNLLLFCWPLVPRKLKRWAIMNDNQTAKLVIDNLFEYGRIQRETWDKLITCVKEKIKVGDESSHEFRSLQAREYVRGPVLRG